MVFSIFGRRDKSDGRKGRDNIPSRASDTSIRPPNSTDSTLIQRELARKTAEKIDQIESEMIAASLPPPPAPKRIQDRNAAAGLAALTGGSPPLAGAPNQPPGGTHSTTVVIGDTAAAGEIHVDNANLPPQLEEAAILFANGQPQPAMATLRSAIHHNEVGGAAQQAWLMLFDIMNHCAMRSEFEATAIDFASTFEKSPPAWRDQQSPAGASDKPVGNGAVLTLPAQLDESITRLVEQAQRAAAAKRPVTLDCRAVEKVQATGAQLLWRMIEAFEQNRRPLVVNGADKLFEATRATVEPGRRDDEALWMLSLELLRVRGEKQQFDDLAIDYCVTFEVSPPSWEPMPDNIRTSPSGESAAVRGPTTGANDSGAFALHGELIGRMQTELAALRTFSHDRADVIIDCRDLGRLDFVAAGELLNEVVTMTARKATVVFVEPSYVVLALLVVMGIHDLADIRRRRI